MISNFGLIHMAASVCKDGRGAISVLHLSPADGLAAARIALVGVGEDAELDEDAVRSAAAAAAQAAAGLGGTLAWAYDDALPLDAEGQVRAVVEGAIIG